MIKKITVCFLVMAIAVGCAQAPGKSEKPVDPPVVEHPQKPVEEIIKIERYEVNVAERQKPYLKFERYNIETPTLLIESEDAKDFNKMMREKTDGFINGIVYQTEINETEPYVKEIQFFTIEVFQSSKVLSIVCKEQPMLYNAGGVIPIYSVYNFDIKNGKQLSNDELLAMSDISVDSYQGLLDIELSKKFLTCNPEFLEPPTKQCYLEKQRSQYHNIGYSEYNENSMIYIDGDSLHTFIKIYIGTSGNIEDIKVEFAK